jgi:hypothetical protein
MGRQFISQKAFCELRVPWLYALCIIHVIRVCVLTAVLTFDAAIPMLKRDFIGRKAHWRKGWDLNPRDQLREEIVAKVIGANLVFADLACLTDDASKTLRPNLNTCIEAGIAMGAERPVFVTALDPASCNPEVRDKTTQLPFMFRNHSIQWYADAVDFLAKIHRLALATRRRIINDELGAETAAARST